MLIGSLYVVQFLPSVEYCKFGLFPPLLFKVKVEFSLAVIATRDSSFFIVQPLGKPKSCAV
jgi:hypothetical protein